MFLQQTFFPIIVTHQLLLCIVSTAELISGAATSGQQSQASAVPLAFPPTTRAPLPQPLTQPIPIVSTFVVHPQNNPTTTPAPNFINQPLQSTTQRLPSTAGSTTLAPLVPGVSFNLKTTTTAPQPSSVSSFFVSKQQPSSLPEADGQAQSRSQETVASESLASVSTPSSLEEFSFTNFSPETTTSVPNRSFEDRIRGNQDGSLHTLNSTNFNRPNFDESHNLMTTLEHQSQPMQDNFAQPHTSTTIHNDLQNSGSQLNVSVVTSANSTQDLQNPNANSPSSQTVPFKHSSANDSREVNNSEGQFGNGMAFPEGRSQSIAQLSPTSSTFQNVSNATSAIEKKVQILKPKSKFRCTQPSDCHNGALCHNGICFCLPGFTSESCDINIDECRQFGVQPCLNDGTCVDEVNGFRCECPPGFRGERCQDLADMCNDSPCLNNATCVNFHTNYTCNCKSGWEGRHCEINIDDCAKGPCQNGALCQDLINGFKCDCPQGFTGTNCEINVDDCATSPCSNNATCRDLINDYECECAPGFVGRNCEENIDECASSPCSHGECADLTNGFRCDCHDGWSGKQCENDINECESARPVCLNSGTCVNLEGSYQCNCRDGYTGRKCSDISDFCKAKQPCGKNGICKNLNLPKSPFQCECFSGYVGNRCERKRVCEPHECNFDHAHCVNNVTCACLPGRREERIMCEYVSSCEQVEGDLCLHGGLCKDLEAGGYHCACPDPWYGPVCQFRAELQLDAMLVVGITFGVFFILSCVVVLLVGFRSVRKARATRGTYSPSTQEKFGNSASDLLKPPIPERLI